MEELVKLQISVSHQIVKGVSALERKRTILARLPWNVTLVFPVFLHSDSLLRQHANHFWDLEKFAFQAQFAR
jgi:hypothetical protein